VRVAIASEPGAVFGELSAFLGGPHKATVRASQPCAFYIVKNPRASLEATPQLCVHVCELLARRLDALNKYLVDVKHQFEGHDHIGMVDGVLEALMHRQPRKHIRPNESTIRQSELSD
jgi:CRP-like cAMP-binding protein